VTIEPVDGPGGQWGSPLEMERDGGWPQAFVMATFIVMASALLAFVFWLVLR
jgi:hypothetical protein